MKLGALSGKVGSSYLGHAMKAVFQSAEAKAQSLLDTNVTNAFRVARTFGELKGAVMKVGQMMSLQEDLLPPEMRDILRGLQSHAPPVPFKRMLPVLKAELGGEVESHFSDISEQACASASIGQVHWAKLKSGPEVVIKIQYPGVSEMVESDLKNLRMFARSIRRVTPIKADLGKFLREVRSRLTEELDYRIETKNMLELRKLFADDERFIIPRVFPELSTRRVLTSEYVPGPSAEEICDQSVPQPRRDRIGTCLFDAVLRQVFEFRTLQADPNLANFAFPDDGRIVMYDFGCVKRFSEPFIEGLRQVLKDALAPNYQRLPADLERIGFVDLGSHRLPLEAFQGYADTIFGEWRKPGLYDFAASKILDDLIELKKQHWAKVFDYDAPADAIFLDRTFAGMYGNLCKLHARVPMHELLEKYAG